MNLNAFKSRQSQGFTLIELLVVITIIAILAGIAIPTTNIVLDKARQLQAKAAMKGLEVAIKGFQTEYNRFPMIDAGRDEDVIDTTDPLLLQVLMAKEGGGTKLNRREIPFYQPPNQKGKANFDPSSGSLYDTFGKGIGYRVQMDYDGDGQIKNPYENNKDLTTSVIVYSAGSNGAWNLGSAQKSKVFDDLKSWE